MSNTAFNFNRFLRNADTWHFTKYDKNIGEKNECFSCFICCIGWSTLNRWLLPIVDQDRDEGVGDGRDPGKDEHHYGG